MNLTTMLEKLARAGRVTQTRMLTATMFSAMTTLGEFRGERYQVAITVVAHNSGANRTTAEVWRGTTRVPKAPLEANWPAVKAIREIAAGDQSDEVVTRLIGATLV